MAAELTAADRDLLRQVAEATFMNPFAPERDALDLQIARCGPETPRAEVLGRVMEQVFLRVRRWEAEGRADLRAYRGEARELAQSAFLFEAFHRFLDDFDDLIVSQVNAGGEPVAVPFARDALSLLARRGFSASEAQRLFGIFYQLRRAYYFIDRSLAGQSRSMRELRLHLWNNVFTCDIRCYERFLWDRMEDFSTLLLGETGTGKGAAAAAIGRSGFIPYDDRRGAFAESFTRNFVSLNLSQHPETLIESELFGHRKGAFTGAIDHHQGIFGRCSPHGAIFLDEIGDVSVPVQIKLLQVLQERTFSPIGSHEANRFQGRVIAATNRPLGELRQSGRFREDFFYRLCSDVVTLPTLRRRLQEDPGELDALLSHVLARMLGEAPADLLGTIREALSSHVPAGYGWPGNVRELEQAVRRILLTRRYRPELRQNGADPSLEFARAVEEGTWDAQRVLAHYCRLLYDRFGSYQEVARRAGLDRRTVRKYVAQAREGEGS
jgi:DNA-binding NtrC family response regulator